MNTVLGLHCLSHDAGAAIIAGGRIFAISEERLSGVKYDGGFPDRSLGYVLDAAGIQSIHDVDLVVFDLIDHCELQIREWLKTRHKYRGRAVAAGHHDAHAASAFFVSPFTQAAVLVVDACGSFADEIETAASPPKRKDPLAREAQSFYDGSGNDLKLVRRTFLDSKYSIGIGILYALASVTLGFGELGAGKVMGLAAYGGRRNIFPGSIFDDNSPDVIARGIPGRDPLRPENFEIYAKRLFGAALRGEHDTLTNHHAEIAACVQQEAQGVMLRLAEMIRREIPRPALCMAGGLALNSIANLMIREQGLFEDVFIQPAASDSGIPLGCALYGYHTVLGLPRFADFENVFLGRPYGREEIESALKACDGIRWTRPRRLPRRCADLLARGKTLGWFQGGSELGPRALGHRSILADPRGPGMKDHLNTAVKHREPFRPFAPVMPRGRTGEYFEPDIESPFMLYVVKCRDTAVGSIPAVLHVDATARLQTLERGVCPKLHDVILEFEGITGVPILLNTSFNDAGRPIVETPADALNTFISTGLDALVIEDFLVEKTRRRSAAPAKDR